MRLPLFAAAFGAVALGGLALILLMPGPSAEPAKAAALGANPVVVELFTSQSCSSCPPAEALFRDYAKRSDLITLEWHVDYWDTLDDPGGGRWKDPYSSPAWTQRQTAYNQSILGTSSVYTPQAVIAGVTQTTGFAQTEIDRYIAGAAAKPSPVHITATRMASSLSFTLQGAPADAEADLVTFRTAADTSVKGGENKGRALSSSHLVTALRKLGAGPELSTPAPAPGDGCALIVHGKGQGAILAAAYCPA